MKHARATGNPDLATPYGLEKRTGISDDSIARYLSGESPVDVDVLEALARVYNLHEAWELLVPDFSPAAPPAEELRTLYDLLASRLELEEAALKRLSGVHGKPRNDKSPDVDRQDANDRPPRSRKPYGHD
jgi:transcriptional regulator with XRE-family HTH domain